MTYTGDVQVGGPADVRELPALTIAKLAVGPFDNNAYLLRCTATGDGLLIDAADEADRLLALIGDGRSARSSQPTGTATTGRPCRRSPGTGATVIAHPLDAAGAAGAGRPAGRARRRDHGRRRHPWSDPPARAHAGLDRPAYRPGGPHLFTGDSLFPGGVGNTTRSERFAQLFDDV